jgi:hypothetical protein
VESLIKNLRDAAQILDEEKDSPLNYTDEAFRKLNWIILSLFLDMLKDLNAEME